MDGPKRHSRAGPKPGHRQAERCSDHLMAALFPRHWCTRLTSESVFSIEPTHVVQSRSHADARCYLASHLFLALTAIFLQIIR